MEEIIEQLIERGSIKVSDEFSFRTKAECASLFGKNYSNILMGGVPHPVDKDLKITFWQQGYNDRWENTYRENSEGEIIEFSEEKKIDREEWIESIRKGERKIIFYKKEKEEYKFRGIFLIDFERSIKEKKKIYLRDSTEAETYQPVNRRPLKNLKEILERGLIKENEEIYFLYKDQEYSGRVTKEGKVKTHLGTMTLNRASWELMFLSSECKRITKRVNAYNWWRIWNGTSLDDLRKV